MWPTFGEEVSSATIFFNGQLLAVGDNLSTGRSIMSFLICACLESRSTTVRKYQAVKVLWPTIEGFCYINEHTTIVVKSPSDD